MSRLGKKSVKLVGGVAVVTEDGFVNFNGKLGKLSLPILPHTSVAVKNDEVFVSTHGSGKQARANWGTMRSLIQNSVIGVSAGFQRVLEIIGIGYRANMEGNTLVLSIGFTHPVRFNPPSGVNIIVEKNFIKISGIDKASVGQAAAKIRSFKKPEPYKGKGIKYEKEVIRRKAGKKVAGTTTK